ncbi:hypothetical protein Btru_031016 [Bulinus truncatus]|nr:hypothetical protein Btru_031016 [Bulinus truncatus]
MAASKQKNIVNIAAKFLELLTIYIVLQIFFSVTCEQYDVFEGFLLCRKCGHEVAKAQHLFSMPSNMALRQRNDTISSSNKVLIQLFKNPHDVYFELITSLHSDLESDTQKYTGNTWFPGYAWSIAKCPKCGTHLGWSYFSIEGVVDSVGDHISAFVGLILDKIMHEDDVSNLIAMPKTYAS